MKEFYLDERPYEGNNNIGTWIENQDPELIIGEVPFWGGGFGGGGGSGGSGGGGGSGGSGSINDIVNKWHLVLNGHYVNLDTLLLTDGEAYLLRCRENLISGSQGCLSIQIYCQVENDPKGNHARCILLSSSLGPLKSNNILNQFAQGEMKLFARWQSGHYDIENHRAVRFKINNFITPWINLNLQGSYTLFATLMLRNGIITVKSIGT